VVVQGVASAAATSVAIPAHQPGDLICVFVRRASNTWPTVPTAGGTVPSWLPTQFGGANTLSMGGWYAVATASNHTTGAWTNADQIIVLVLRPDAGKVLTVNAGAAGVTSGNNTQTIIYPALVLQKTDGTSWVVRCGTRGVAVSTVATAPTNYTNRAVQPAGASALIAVHTRAGVTSNPTQDTVSTTGTNAAYRAISFEVLEGFSAQSVSVGGVSSPAVFGAVTALVAQTAQVGSVYPPGYAPSITGLVVSGDGHLVGGTTAGQFGAVVASFVAPQTKPVPGLSSAQAFGVPTVKTAITRAPLGVSSAQAFGTPTPKTVIRVTPAGVPSAQAFGLVLMQQGGGKVSVPGVFSAQAFGTPTPRVSAVTTAAPGLSSAQAFGALRFLLTASISGVASAQAFGEVSTAQRRPVGGVSSAQQFGVPTGNRSFTVPGVPSAQAFGVVKGRYLIQAPGLASAQNFGLVTSKAGRVIVALAGLPSEQAFGIPLVRDVWIQELPCTDMALLPASEQSLVLVPDVEQALELEPLVCK